MHMTVHANAPPPPHTHTLENMLQGQGGFLGHEMPAKKKTEESYLKNKMIHHFVEK